MRVRAIDAEGNWEYGKGQNDYKRDRKAVSQNIKTRIKSFLNNCFFDAAAGIDWFNYLGSKDQLGLQLAISAVILNTDGVVTPGIISLTSSLSRERDFRVQYQVNTVFGLVVETVQLSNRLTTQDGDVITTESGEPIIT